MNVSEAVAARRSTRAYLDRPVEPGLIETLAVAAARAASGGNLQPWHIDIVTGATLAALKSTMRDTLAAGRMEVAEYAVYPPELDDPHRTRRRDIGEAMYATLGIAREDKAARHAWFARNFAFFDAPAALFVTIGRSMGPPQWSDLGEYLATFMLLATERGLGTCAQECWAMYPGTVKAAIGTPVDRMLFCGMAIGWPDPGAPVAALHSDRAPPAEWLRTHG